MAKIIDPEFGALADYLDDSLAALRRFKDKLDRIPDPKRDAAFTLAWPEHPCFETLIHELGKWADLLRAPREAESVEDLYQLTTLDALTDQYQSWMAQEGVTLGSADEHLNDEALSGEQRLWLVGFVARWALAEKWEHELCRRLDIESTPARLEQYRVHYAGKEYPLLGFAMVNDESPEVVEELLLDRQFGVPVQIPVHAGYDEITLLGNIVNESTSNPDAPWWRCLCNNDPEHVGFGACDSKGKSQVEEGGGPLKEWDGEHHVCLACGAYFGRDLKILGVAVRA